LILVDSSIWIDLFSAKPSFYPLEEDLLRYATCGPIIQEVLQGLRPGPQSNELRQAFLALPCLSDPLSSATFLHAADIYRDARFKGYTIRSSVDCLIAAIAIEHQIPVFHNDRDFRNIARCTPLMEISHEKSIQVPA
jgi:predicted nucleic acid-binding protein